MRLIDAEALKNKFEEKINRLKRDMLRENDISIFSKIKLKWLKDFLELINNAPTTEAKPVVHAHWNDDGRCTNCGGHAPFFAWTDEWFGTKFCPHCGAQIHKSISCNHEDDNHIAEDGKKGIKIPVISMEDVPNLAKEMEK